MPRNLPPSAAVLGGKPPRESAAAGKKNPANGGETPGGWLEKRKNTLRLIRSLKKPGRAPLRLDGKTGSRPARRPEKPAPPPGPLGLWVDWDAARYA
ncbi:MAG: hypothetical protein IPL30_03070 [Elusimicrobia bacterium]|nr:hypothetical protein [Elusimicrobiota bacterium]